MEEKEETQQLEEIAEIQEEDEAVFQPTYSGWYFLRIILFGIPVLGLVLSIISVYKNTDKQRRYFTKAFVAWNCVSLLLLAFTAYIVSGYLKVTDASLHYYLGEYGSTLELVQDFSSGDIDTALGKLDLDRFTEKIEEEGVFESKELRKFFTKIDWSLFTPEERQQILDSIQQSR